MCASKLGRGEWHSSGICAATQFGSKVWHSVKFSLWCCRPVLAIVRKGLYWEISPRTGQSHKYLCVYNSFHQIFRQYISTGFISIMWNKSNMHNQEGVSSHTECDASQCSHLMGKSMTLIDGCNASILWEWWQLYKCAGWLLEPSKWNCSTMSNPLNYILNIFTGVPWIDKVHEQLGRKESLTSQQGSFSRKVMSPLQLYLFEFWAFSEKWKLKLRDYCLFSWLSYREYHPLLNPWQQKQKLVLMPDNALFLDNGALVINMINQN